jgi:hypothetical protein
MIEISFSVKLDEDAIRAAHSLDEWAAAMRLEHDLFLDCESVTWNDVYLTIALGYLAGGDYSEFHQQVEVGPGRGAANTGRGLDRPGRRPMSEPSNLSNAVRLIESAVISLEVWHGQPDPSNAGDRVRAGHDALAWIDAALTEIQAQRAVLVQEIHADQIERDARVDELLARGRHAE